MKLPSHAGPAIAISVIVLALAVVLQLLDEYKRGGA